MLTVCQRVRISRARWLKAQEHEQAFWRRLGSRIADGTEHGLDWYRWRAAQLTTWLDPTASMKAGRVLEIGSGPIGIVSFLGWGHCTAVDPLEPFYSQEPDLIALRNPEVEYLAGTGEQLPIPDGSVALVIIDNVIDHTYSPGRILEGIRRVLQKDGIVYLCVNVHTQWGAWLHDVLATFRIDKRHPFTFTRRTLVSLLERHGFGVLRDRIEDYDEVKEANRQSARVTDWIKSRTGLSEIRYEVLTMRIEDCGVRVEKFE